MNLFSSVARLIAVRRSSGCGFVADVGQAAVSFRAVAIVVGLEASDSANRFGSTARYVISSLNIEDIDMAPVRAYRCLVKFSSIRVSEITGMRPSYLASD